MADLVPAFQLRVGSSQPGRHDRLHNSAYQPDERCIGFGVQALSRAALELLGMIAWSSQAMTTTGTSPVAGREARADAGKRA